MVDGMAPPITLLPAALSRPWFLLHGRSSVGNGIFTSPARFSLVAVRNPCPCSHSLR